MQEEKEEDIFYICLNKEYEMYNLKFATYNILHAKTFEYFALHMPKICNFINKVSGEYIFEEYSITIASASLHFFISAFHSMNLSYIQTTPMLEVSLPLVNSVLHNTDLFTNLLKSESAIGQCIIQSMEDSTTKMLLSNMFKAYQMI